MTNESDLILKWFRSLKVDLLKFDAHAYFCFSECQVGSVMLLNGLILYFRSWTQVEVGSGDNRNAEISIEKFNFPVLRFPLLYHITYMQWPVKVSLCTSLCLYVQPLSIKN